MTPLDQAIQHAEEIADSYKDTAPDADCAQEHRRLAEWLRELRQLRGEARKCPCCCRVSHGVVSCELDYPHEGPHKDGDVRWTNTMQLTLVEPLPHWPNPNCAFCEGIGTVKVTLLTDEQKAANQAWSDSFKDGFHTGHCPHLELPTYACEDCLTKHPEATRV